MTAGRPSSGRCGPYRFSLNTMFAYVSAFCLIVYLIVWDHSRAYELTKTICAIEEEGGEVSSAYNLKIPGTVGGVTFSEPATDTSLHHLENLPHITYLWLRGPGFPDECVEHVCKLKGLTFLDLGGTRLTEEAVRTLVQKLPNCNVHIYGR